MDGEQSFKRSVCSIRQIDRKISFSLIEETLLSLKSIS